MKRIVFSLAFLTIAAAAYSQTKTKKPTKTSGNPVFEGWYADPEGIIYGNEYWIYPTWSAPYEEQVFMDAFSSKDLVNWTKHERIIDTAEVKWAKKAMWAPGVIKKDGRSEEHTSELQSLMRSSYAVFCLKTTRDKHNRTKK